MVLPVVATVLLVAAAAPSGGQSGGQTGPWVEPVPAPVVDGYRPPAHIGAPGNRGWEYRTEPGTVVVAAGTGVVVFAGSIGGSDYVSIAHPDGRRTTYSHVATISVVVGERVGAGEAIATSGERLHFGVRFGDRYLDPGELFEPMTAGVGNTSPMGEGLRLLPTAERTGATRAHSPGGAQSRGGPRVAGAPAPLRPTVSAQRAVPGPMVEPAVALGPWLASFDMPVPAGRPPGWSGAATGTLADGPQHTAVGP